MAIESTKVVAKENDDQYRDVAKHKSRRLYLSLPVPPSVNHMYRPTRKFGVKVLTAQAQRYVATSRALINQYIEEQHWEKQSGAVWYYVDLVFYFPDRRIRDSHNTLKLLLDVMQDLVYHNDFYVLPRIHSVEYDKDNPRVEVCVSVQDKTQRERGVKMTTYISH